MADDAAPSGPEPKKKQGGLPLKTMVAVLVLMVLEGGGIVAAMMLLGSPSEVGATLTLEGESDPLETRVEIPVLNERFVNNAEGRVWVWDTELLVVCKERYRDEVEGRIAKQEAAIRTGIGGIWSAARHADFNEPGRVTLTNQVLDYLRSGPLKKPTSEHEELVLDVLIPKCMGFPSDY